MEISIFGNEKTEKKKGRDEMPIGLCPLNLSSHDQQDRKERRELMDGIRGSPNVYWVPVCLGTFVLLLLGPSKLRVAPMKERDQVGGKKKTDEREREREKKGVTTGRLSPLETQEGYSSSSLNRT